MATPPDPERSGAVEIATRRRPRLWVVWGLRELTHKQKPRLWSLPARLGPVTVHHTRWSVGPNLSVLFFCHHVQEGVVDPPLGTPHVLLSPLNRLGLKRENMSKESA